MWGEREVEALVMRNTSTETEPAVIGAIDGNDGPIPSQPDTRRPQQQRQHLDSGTMPIKMFRIEAPTVINVARSISR